MTRFDNPLEFLLHTIPDQSYIFGSFATHLCFSHQFHKTNILSKECVKQFFDSESDIDLFVQYQDLKRVTDMLELVGKIEVLLDNARINDDEYGKYITKVIWSVDDYRPIPIDFVHTINNLVVDFTCNNWMVTKFITTSNISLYDGNEKISTKVSWILKCRVEFVSHNPLLNPSLLAIICYSDTISKKINLMLPVKQIKKRIPKLVARTYKLLKNKFTFTDDEMITGFPVPIRRFKLVSDYNNDCPICLKKCDDNSVVMDCSHTMHANCMQEYCVMKISETSHGTIDCPLCRQLSTFMKIKENSKEIIVHPKQLFSFLRLFATVLSYFVFYYSYSLIQFINNCIFL